MATKRADAALHEWGYFESRAKAREAIEAGLVTVDGRVVAKPSAPIAEGATISAAAPYPWVSRGGVKLAHALDAFGVDPQDRYCLDVGASTGGFTDVLLTRGARHVAAVDVGHDQLHEKLRSDARVTSMEGQDARTLTLSQLHEAPSLIVMDASFISLSALLPNVLTLAASQCELVALIKPQFEAGRAAVKKGVVRDEKIHAEVCDKARREIETLGWRVLGVVASPIEGGDGNREFLIHAARP
ncbi:TlyA family RNA methyltransferase [Methylocystis sp. MJC1]|jgi:23S rRNA (cytidine1920-2'-O)/16S rRNA (cytidine1409-2'-O)-methyltransferase|uniref:TlyA family RNA methyltransferase n=1 Tax=Methylocystis sp. MJC1 TaxID=2654282 RepID=UPI0013EE0B02|nr:TlyA family RNA methyltransferase [Methylocystis sp. MJC1]KAF2990504.1 Hemolysin A [Methylocystis sp. MJC1]MBU6525833.1 TlyA family RNA methyltransferase [Methylocystis sp. MJC1]UZX12300.1 TlyA family RNA methyltransferase [Methylocystis sp. MJC1]